MTTGPGVIIATATASRNSRSFSHPWVCTSSRATRYVRQPVSTATLGPGAACPAARRCRCCARLPARAALHSVRVSPSPHHLASRGCGYPRGLEPERLRRFAVGNSSPATGPSPLPARLEDLEGLADVTSRGALGKIFLRSKSRHLLGDRHVDQLIPPRRLRPWQPSWLLPSATAEVSTRNYSSSSTFLQARYRICGGQTSTPNRAARGSKSRRLDESAGSWRDRSLLSPGRGRPPDQSALDATGTRIRIGSTTAAITSQKLPHRRPRSLRPPSARVASGRTPRIKHQRHRCQDRIAPFKRRSQEHSRGAAVAANACRNQDVSIENGSTEHTSSYRMQYHL